MHDKDLIKILQNVRGETDAPLHRAVLRRAILSKKRERYAPLQHFLTIISMNKYYLSVGTVAAVAAIATVVALSPISPSVVSAQEQVQRAFTRAAAISPEMRAKIEEHMKADMLKTLEEAKAAPDLKIMTKEEYEKEAQFTLSHAPAHAMTGAIGGKAVHTISFKHEAEAGAGGEDIMFNAKADAPAHMEGSFSAGRMIMGAGIAGTEVLEPVKYLSYTDPEGRKTVLGLDQNDTPVFKFVTLREGDIKHLQDGMIGIEPTHVKMINAGAVEMIEAE